LRGEKGTPKNGKEKRESFHCKKKKEKDVQGMRKKWGGGELEGKYGRRPTKKGRHQPSKRQTSGPKKKRV